MLEESKDARKMGGRLWPWHGAQVDNHQHFSQRTWILGTEKDCHAMLAEITIAMRPCSSQNRLMKS